MRGEIDKMENWLTKGNQNLKFWKILSLSRIVYSENRAKSVAGQGFAKEVRHVTLFKRGYKISQ